MVNRFSTVHLRDHPLGSSSGALRTTACPRYRWRRDLRNIPSGRLWQPDAAPERQNLSMRQLRRISDYRSLLNQHCVIRRSRYAKSGRSHRIELTVSKDAKAVPLAATVSGSDNSAPTIQRPKSYIDWPWWIAAIEPSDGARSSAAARRPPAGGAAHRALWRTCNPPASVRDAQTPVAAPSTRIEKEKWCPPGHGVIVQQRGCRGGSTGHQAKPNDHA